MNVKEALEKLKSGERVKTMFDGTGVFYQMFSGDNTIARMIAKSYCSAETVACFTPEEFLTNHSDITMIEVEL